MAPRFWFAGSHEEFPPSELLEQAIAAERAGFEGIGCSDHYAPWFPTASRGTRRRGLEPWGR
jgi:coenzyme F420-dependent glucose-6-phosphate dehydrogenase